MMEGLTKVKFMFSADKKKLLKILKSNNEADGDGNTQKCELNR